MSVISRSSRPTSCFSMAISRSRAAGSRDQVQGLHRRADRGQRVRISWATSAAKRFDGVHALRQGGGHGLAATRARSPTSSWRSAMSGREMARARDSRTRSAARASRRIGWAISQLSSRDEHRITRHRDQDEGDQRPALGGDDLVDVAGLQRQHAEHRLHPLDRDRDADHPVAVLGAAQPRPPVALQRRLHLARPGRRALAARSRVGASGPAAPPGRDELAALAGRRQRLPLHPVGDQVAVGDQLALAVEQPRALRPGDEQQLQRSRAPGRRRAPARARRGWRACSRRWR